PRATGRGAAAFVFLGGEKCSWLATVLLVRCRIVPAPHRRAAPELSLAIGHRVLPISNTGGPECPFNRHDLEKQAEISYFRQVVWTMVGRTVSCSRSCPTLCAARPELIHFVTFFL